MKKLQFTYRQMKRASTLLSLGLSELEAAEALIEKELFREAAVHLYFASYYTAQSFLAPHISNNPSHKNIETQLHKHFGKRKGFPRKYIDLHKVLHRLRNEFNYKYTHSPSPTFMQSKLRALQKFVSFALKNIPKLETGDLLHAMLEENKSDICDFSYDIYCPKTYRHHVRMTLWQPATHLDIFSPIKAATRVKRLLKDLRVNRHEDYVVGLNSRVSQYADDHLLMLDIDSLDVAVENVLSEIGGVLLKSGRGFHFIGAKVIKGQRNWVRELRRLNSKRGLRQYLDQSHIEISLQRGYSTLRITKSSVKPVAPVFYKEITQRT